MKRIGLLALRASIGRAGLGIAMWLMCSVASAGIISLSTPTSPDAGTVGLGVTAEKKSTFTIQNASNSTLTITGVTSSNPEFVVTQPVGGQLPVVLSGNATYFFVVKFTPTTLGTRSSTITIISDDQNGNTAFPVTATGYGGREVSVSLTPTDIGVERGQGLMMRAKVTFDNGVVGNAKLTWTSTNTAVVIANEGPTDLITSVPTPTGQIRGVGVGQVNVTARGVTNTAAVATTAVKVVAPSTFQFLGTAFQDRVVDVNSGAVSTLYDFPDDTTGTPIFETGQIGAKTANTSITGFYVAADDVNTAGENAFHCPIPCVTPVKVFDRPGEAASFVDIEVNKANNAYTTNLSTSSIWQLTPTSSSLFTCSGLSTADIGTLGIDTNDKLYVASVFTTPMVLPSVVRCDPVTLAATSLAALFNAERQSALAVSGIVSVPSTTPSLSKFYVLKLVTLDSAVIESYVDLNGDGNFYQIVGTSILADAGEVVQVGTVAMGVDITKDASQSLIAAARETMPLGGTGRRVERVVDANNNGNFNDPFERTVIFQSTATTRLTDAAFAAPCQEQPPVARISVLPPTAIVQPGENVFFLGGGSSDPCGQALTYKWDLGDGMTSTDVTAGRSFAQPGKYKVTLIVTDSVGTASPVTEQIVTVGLPEVSGFWPGNGPASTKVWVFGRNFIPVAGRTRVSVGGVSAPLVQVVSQDLLIFFMPSGSPTGPITVSTFTPVGNMVGTQIGSANSPVNWPVTINTLGINGFWPGQVKVGAKVWVFGTGFCNTSVGCTIVTLNGQRAFAVQVVSPNLLIFFVPTGATTGKIGVTVGTTTVTSTTNLTIVP